MNSYAERLASFTSWPHVCPTASTVARAGFHREFDPTFPSPDLTVCSLCGLDPCDWDSDGSPFEFHATRSPECPFVRATQQKKKDRNQKTRRQQYKRRSLQAATPPAHQSTQLSTQSATLPEHSAEQEEESLQQANAENTAEKPSGSKAPSTKNTGLLSTIPRHIATQQAENDTAIWPLIPTALMWYITAMSTQGKDLLRRSQPSHYDPLSKRKIGRCIFGRIETVRCLAPVLFERLSLRQENTWDAHH